MTDVMATWTGAAATTATAATEGPSSSVPGYGIFATADGGQVALGVVNEQHFWSALCTELGIPELADQPFHERTRQGIELNEAVGDAIAPRSRDELVAALRRAGVPVAPVFDRTAMMAYAPFPPFPIRMPTGPQSTAPALDEHRGEGFRPTR
jgi:crotonobetainyl-CoA:carnitine CoA-transferase CaiB-like acyl-CoA transferase